MPTDKARFSFSPDAREELKSILLAHRTFDRGRVGELIAWTERLTGHALSLRLDETLHATWSRARRRNPPLRRLGVALQRVLGLLSTGTIDKETVDDIETGLGHYCFETQSPLEELPSLGRLQVEASRAAKVVRWILDGPYGRSPGRRGPLPREDPEQIAANVAQCLQDFGIRPTKARGGCFHRVLIVVLGDLEPYGMNVKGTQDQFELLRRGLLRRSMQENDRRPLLLRQIREKR